MAVLTAFLSLLLLPALSVGQPSGGPASVMAPACEPTPGQDVLSVVGPMAGSWPAWVVDGSDTWHGATHPAKTLWVVAQLGQRVEITGRLLNGAAVAQFSRGSGPATPTLVVDDPLRESVRPGGATAEVLRAYAFIMSHVFYPVPGCWEFTVGIGSKRHKIVRNIEPSP